MSYFFPPEVLMILLLIAGAIMTTRIIGFLDAYLILGCIVLTVTIISAFTLSKRPVVPGVDDTQMAKAS